MAWNWKQRRSDEFESRLRAERERPPAEFVDSLVSRIESVPRRFKRSRLVLAASVSGVLLVGMSVFGGLGYASSAGHSLQSLKGVSKVANIIVVSKTASKPSTQHGRGGGDHGGGGGDHGGGGGDHGGGGGDHGCNGTAGEHQYKSKCDGRSQEDGRSGKGHSNRGGGSDRDGH
jgi:hypothetical protein